MSPPASESRVVSLVGEVTSRKRQVLVVYNPEAGRGHARAVAKELKRQLKRELITFEWRKTEEPGHAAELVRKATRQEFHRILLVGGDGTLADTVAGLASRPDAPPVALIPAGTGNDVARTLGVAGKSLGHAIRVAMSGAEVALDAGRIGDRLFVNGFGAGIDGEVAERSRSIRWARGIVPYLVGVALTLPRWKPFRYIATLDGERFEGDATLVTFANGATCGGGFRLTPRARPADGLLDACLVPGRSRPALAIQLPSALSGTHIDQPGVVYRQVRTIEIEFDRPIAAHVDGNLVPGLTRATLEVLPGALAAMSASAKI